MKLINPVLLQMTINSLIDLHRQGVDEDYDDIVLALNALYRVRNRQEE